MRTMKAFQMTLDQELMAEVDRVARELGTTRSGFTRSALRQALDLLYERVQEERHRRGYLEHPARPEEFDDWEDEQAWGDAWPET